MMTFNYAYIATYSLMRTFEDGQLTVSHGTQETGDIHGYQSGGTRPGDHLLVAFIPYHWSWSSLIRKSQIVMIKNLHK